MGASPFLGGISASNSTVKFGPNPAWTPIFSQFGSRLTTSQRLRRSPGRGSMSPTWGPSEPPWRGQTTLELAENWSPGRFWPKLHCGVWGGNPKQIWAGLCAANGSFNTHYSDCKFPHWSSSGLFHQFDYSNSGYICWSRWHLIGHYLWQQRCVQIGFDRAWLKWFLLALTRLFICFLSWLNQTGSTLMECTVELYWL